MENNMQKKNYHYYSNYYLCLYNILYIYIYINTVGGYLLLYGLKYV